MANDNNICKECGGPVLVQIQKNTGFCCPQHERAFEGKPEPEPEVKVKKGKKPKKGKKKKPFKAPLRVPFCREGADTVLGYYYEPDALRFDPEQQYVVSWQNSGDLEDLIGKATNLRRESDGWITAEVAWLNDKGFKVGERMAKNEAFATIYANELFTEGNIKSGSIRVTSLNLKSIFITPAEQSPWADPE